MFDPENDWVKKRNTRSAMGRRTVLVGNVKGEMKYTSREVKAEEVVKMLRFLTYQ